MPPLGQFICSSSRPQPGNWMCTGTKYDLTRSEGGKARRSLVPGEGCSSGVSLQGYLRVSVLSVSSPRVGRQREVVCPASDLPRRWWAGLRQMDATKERNARSSCSPKMDTVCVPSISPSLRLS